MPMCMPVYLHVYLCICTCACVCSACLCACMCVAVYVCVYMSVYVCACICVCALEHYKLLSVLGINFSQPVWWPQGSLPVSGHSTPSTQFHPGTLGNTHFSSQSTLLHSSLLLCLIFSRQPCFIVMCECMHMHVYAYMYACIFVCIYVCVQCMFMGAGARS